MGLVWKYATPFRRLLLAFVYSPQREAVRSRWSSCTLWLTLLGSLAVPWPASVARQAGIGRPHASNLTTGVYIASARASPSP